MTSWRLVADIGGTNIRIAQSSREGQFEERKSYLIKDHKNFQSAYQAYQSEAVIHAPFVRAVLGVAGPVSNGTVALTNNSWTLNEEEISEILGKAPVRIINDLEAVAHALPYISDEVLVAIGNVAPSSNNSHRKLAVNIGTGFGAAALIPAGTSWVSCSTEAGHMSLCAESHDELTLLEGLDPPAKSVENILSGQGLVKLHNSLVPNYEGLYGVTTSSEVIDAIGRNKAAEVAMTYFTRFLGRVVGDLTLALGCWGGVYMVGGVIEGWSRNIDANLFRSQFENKGLMKHLQENVFTGVVTQPDISLAGLTYA